MIQTTIQFDLDGMTRPPCQGHSVTSRAAAKEISKPSATLKERVLDRIIGCGMFGCTDEEIQISLEMNPSTQRPRRIDLVRCGQVEDSGLKRKTRSGRNAVVWIATRNNFSG